MKALTRDETLDDSTLYRPPNTESFGARLYRQNGSNNYNVFERKTTELSVSVGVSVFPGELHRASRSWAERVSQADLLPGGGQGRPLRRREQPHFFNEEIRAAFRSPG